VRESADNSPLLCRYTQGNPVLSNSLHVDVRRCGATGVTDCLCPIVHDVPIRQEYRIAIRCGPRRDGAEFHERAGGPQPKAGVDDGLGNVGQVLQQEL
jgi:hypothetical protein